MGVPRRELLKALQETSTNSILIRSQAQPRLKEGKRCSHHCSISTSWDDSNTLKWNVLNYYNTPVAPDHKA